MSFDFNEINFAKARNYLKNYHIPACDLDDLVQDALVSVLVAQARGETIRHVGYFAKALQFRAIDYLRRRKTRTYTSVSVDWRKSPRGGAVYADRFDSNLADRAGRWYSAMRDRSGRGERPVDYVNPTRVLTDEQEQEVRRLYDAGGHSHRGLAKQYGVGLHVIQNALKRTDPQRSAVARRGGSPRPRKLTPEQEAQIVERYLAGGVTKSALAQEFGVAAPTIANVLRRTPPYAEAA